MVLTEFCIQYLNCEGSFGNPSWLDRRSPPDTRIRTDVDVRASLTRQEFFGRRGNREDRLRAGENSPGAKIQGLISCWTHGFHLAFSGGSSEQRRRYRVGVA